MRKNVLQMRRHNKAGVREDRNEEIKEKGRDAIKKITRLLAWEDLAGDRAILCIGISPYCNLPEDMLQLRKLRFGGTEEEKQIRLQQRQKDTLDKFLARNAISRQQYEAGMKYIEEQGRS